MVKKNQIKTLLTISLNQNQPKQGVPVKVEQPTKDNAKVDKKSDSQSNVVDKKDTDNQNKVAVNNQKSEPQSSDVSKKVDVKKKIAIKV
ncbi:hypothetical protein ABKP99_09995 [Mammaliicoccus sciuri]